VISIVGIIIVQIQLRIDQTVSQDSPEYAVETLARRQSFEGYFDGHADIFELVIKGKTAPPVPDFFGGTDELKEKIWYTLLCIGYLETKLTEEKEVWELIVEKANAWLESTLAGLVGANRVSEVKGIIYEEAKRYLK